MAAFVKSGGMFTFQGKSEGPPSSQNASSFEFKPDYTGPVPDFSNVPTGPRERNSQQNSREQRPRESNRLRDSYRPDRQPGRRPGNARPRWQPAAHSRPLLQNARQSTPEQLAGMNEDTRRFDLDAASESETDEGEGAAGSMNEVFRSKWSNPDPYTVLPAGDVAKKRDVVKLIRKAKVAVAPIPNGLEANEDFISFGFEPEPEPP
jgi:non-canonical poly(A) RNA polymerase PAPD5/7